MSMTTTPQELHWRAAANGFVLARGTHPAEEQLENQIKQCSDGEQNFESLWFPWWFYVVLDSLLWVPMALFF